MATILEKEIEQAVENIKKKQLAPIVRYFDGYIIMAQSERDYLSKENSIRKGDIFGFYTVETALNKKY